MAVWQEKLETPVISLSGFHIFYTVLHTHIELVRGIQFDIKILILTVRRSLIRKKKKLKTVEADFRLSHIKYNSLRKTLGANGVGRLKFCIIS